MSTGTMEPANRLSKLEAARDLARRHYEIDLDLVTIFRLEQPGERDEDPIKLLEVNRETVTAGIMPLGFPPSPHRGHLYATIIVEITPEEFEQVWAGSLSLPSSWRIVDEIVRDAECDEPILRQSGE